MRRVVSSKPKTREVGDDAEHAAGGQAALGAASCRRGESGAGDEVDLLDEAALLVLHRDDHVGRGSRCRCRRRCRAAASSALPGSPMNDELRLPYWSICAPPMKPTST